MSNVVRNMQRKPNRLTKSDIKRANEMSSTKQPLNLSDKTFDKHTMYVDVHTGDIVIADGVTKVKDIAPVIRATHHNIEEVFAIFEQYTDAIDGDTYPDNYIGKIVLDNHTDFKLTTLSSFGTDIFSNLPDEKKAALPAHIRVKYSKPVTDELQ